MQFIPRSPRGFRSSLLILALLLSLLPQAALAQGDAPLGPSGEVLMRDDAPRISSDNGAQSAESMIATASSGDYRIDGLLSGNRWPIPSPKLTYSFYDDEVFGGAYYGSEQVSEVSEAVKANVRQILAQYGAMINLTFVELTETPSRVGLLRVMQSSAANYAYAYYPTNILMFDTAGDIHLSPAYDRTGDTNGFQNPPGSHGYMTLAHEIGHALGLKHSHQGKVILPAGEDNTSTTIMSYDFKGPSAGTPMPFDLLALRYLYGVREQATGDDTYILTRDLDQYLLGGVPHLDTMWHEKLMLWDAGGLNTLDLSQTPVNSGGLRLDLRPIGWLTTNAAYHGEGERYFDCGIAIPEGVTIRDVVNSPSSDTIFANAVANTIKGYGPDRAVGADVIYGATAADAIDLSGYLPEQVMQAQSGNDHVISLGADGSITLKDYYLSANNRPAIRFAVAPSALSAIPAGATAITLTWADNSIDESGFYIERDAGAGWTRIATVAAGVTSYTDIGLTAGATYSYRGQAYGPLGASSYSNTATATTPGAPLIHVGGLDGSGKTVAAKSWAATVTVTIHDAAEEGVAGAVVTGEWGGAALGSQTCTTGKQGTCRISAKGLSLSAASATFTVTSVTRSGTAYAPARNHGGIDGTTVTVTR